MSGSVTGQQSKNIVAKIDASQAVTGKPGDWSISAAHAIIASQLSPQPIAGGASPVPGPGPMTAGEAAVAQAAITQSNAAANATPSAASGTPTTSNTTIDTITNIAKGLSNIANTPANIKQLEAGTTATLHWWGWEADLNESATQALLSLLGTDIAGLVTIATALSAVSAPLAAIAAIVGAVTGALDTWITNEDAAKGGVIIDGYLWVGIWVKPA